LCGVHSCYVLNGWDKSVTLMKNTTNFRHDRQTPH